MSIIISIIFSVITAYIIYKCFENYGFTSVLIVSILINLVQGLINNGFSKIFLVIILAVIFGIIEAFIYRIAYNKTNSFKSFFIVLLLIGIIVPLIMGGIVALLLAGTALF